MDPVTLASISPLGGQNVSGFDNRAVSAPQATPGNGMSFSDALSQSAASFKNSIETAEATSIQGLKGEVDAYQVATTVMEAEQQLRMASTIRDRAIQAFQEISRMQI